MKENELSGELKQGEGVAVVLSFINVEVRWCGVRIGCWSLGHEVGVEREWK